MTREDFIAAFVNPSEDDGASGHEKIFARVRDRLRRLTDQQQFRILFPIAVKRQWPEDFPVCDAAILLWELSPDCPIPCEDAVRALLPAWDVSIEEVPFYLAARFGSQRVRQAVRAVESDVPGDSDKNMLSTILYWLDAYDEAYPHTST